MCYLSEHYNKHEWLVVNNRSIKEIVRNDVCVMLKCVNETTNMRSTGNYEIA